MTMDTVQDFNVDAVRRDFPILKREVNGKPLVYFDNAATTQKPQVVIDALSNYYRDINSNVHRGVHHLSQKATDAFEQGRRRIQQHLNAAKSSEIIFTKGVTDGINLVSTSLGRGIIKSGDEIIISTLEHHSNIVPWQILCEQTGAKLKVIPINDRGELELEAYEELLSERTRLVAVNHISNALGTINPVEEIIAQAHKKGAWVLIDGAQSLPHMKVDVQALGADFYVFSAHKVYGPTGFGALYGKEEILNEMPPYQGGGEMIAEVSFEKTTYADLPHKFEAGTPHIAGAVAMNEVFDYLDQLGMDEIARHEANLLDYGTAQLKERFPDLRIIGEAEHKASVISFVLGDIHPYDLGVLLDQQGIAMRTGHHCNQPLMKRFGIPGTLRASFSFYNTREEIDRMIAALEKAHQMLA